MNRRSFFGMLAGAMACVAGLAGFSRSGFRLKDNVLRVEYKTPPWAAVHKAVGTVNDGAFFGTPAGRGLLQSAEAKFRRDAAGKVLWRFEYRFQSMSGAQASGPYTTADHAALLADGTPWEPEQA